MKSLKKKEIAYTFDFIKETKEITKLETLLLIYVDEACDNIIAMIEHEYSNIDLTELIAQYNEKKQFFFEQIKVSFNQIRNTAQTSEYGIKASRAAIIACGIRLQIHNTFDAIISNNFYRNNIIEETSAIV
jgi:hypothetical protein